MEGRQLDPKVERVLFALGANPAIDPSSKRAAIEWAANDVHLAGVGDTQVFCRAMDGLVEP